MTNTDHPASKIETPAVPGLAIGLVGAATLLLEILLTRIFSVTMWYHFAFVAVSLALFGIAASGVMLSLATRFFRRERAMEQMGWASFAFGVLAVVSFLTDLRIPLLPFDVPEVGVGRAYAFLTAKFLVLSLPFLMSGLAIGLAFTHFPSRVHRTYFADLVGGALGCLLVVPVLKGVSGPSAIFIVASLAFCAAAIIFQSSGRERPALCAVVAVLLAVGAMAFNEITGLVRIDQVKSYDPQIVQEPERPKVYERWHPVSRVAVHPLELSGNPWSWFYSEASKPSPRLMEVTNDGGARTYMYPRMEAEDLAQLFRHDLSDLAHVLVENPDVLVIGVGGGKDVLSALALEAASVTAVEMNPLMIEVVQEAFADFTGAPFDDPRVRVVIDEGRNFIASRPDRYELIKISVTDTWAASAVGAYALNESYLYTLEAMAAFLSHLEPGGYLSIVRWYPHESLRLAVLVEAALRRAGFEDPGSQVLMVRNRSTVNTIVKNGVFTAAEIDLLQQRAREAGLRWVGGAGGQVPPVTRPNVGDGRVVIDVDELHRRAVRGAGPRSLEDELPFDLDPPTDDRPFFFNPVGLKGLRAGGHEVLGGFGFQHGRALSLLLALLKITAGVGFVLVILPLLRRTSGDQALPLGFRGATSVYFLMLGLGYLLVEIPMLQQFILFLGHPTYAVAVVLFALLISSGAGSFLAEKLLGAGPRFPVALFAALVVLLVAVALALPHVLRAAIGYDFSVRILLAFVFIVPVGLLLGMPFPIGLRSLHERGAGSLVPWAWAINGAASVAAPALAMIGAIVWGFSRVYALGTVCYLLAALLLWVVRRRPTSLA